MGGQPARRRRAERPRSRDARCGQGSAPGPVEPALTRDQREEIIRQPVANAGATIEPILVERLLNDSGGDLDQLPVLQHCLLRIWQKAGERDGIADPPDAAEAKVRELTEADYAAAGGMDHAMSRHADEICGRLPGKGGVIERVFKALSELRDNRAIRRVVSFETLLAETGADEASLREVLDAFRDEDCSFLIPPLSGIPRLAPGTMVDIGHEALLRRWEKLTGDPAATGEATDERPIGWLREQWRDARSYVSLLAMVEHDPRDEVTLDEAFAKDRALWWDRLKPTPQWAARCGGGFAKVRKLIRRSQDNAARLQRSRRDRKWLTAGGLAIAILVMVALFNRFQRASIETRQAEVMQAQALLSAKEIVEQVHKSVLPGDIKVEGAERIFSTLDKIIDGISPENRKDRFIRHLSFDLRIAEFDVFYVAGKYAKAAAMTDLAEKETADFEKDDSGKFALYNLKFRQGDIYAKQKNFDLAINRFRDAHEVVQRALQSQQRQKSLIFVQGKIGETQQGQKNWDAALGTFQNALAIADQLVASDPKNEEWQRQRAVVLTKIGLVLSSRPTPDITRAIAVLDEAIAIQLRLVRFDKPGQITPQSNLATSYNRKAKALASFQDKPRLFAAFAYYNSAIEIHRQIYNTDLKKIIWLDLLSSDYKYYGEALEIYGDTEGALDFYKTAFELRSNSIEEDPLNKNYLLDRARLEKKVSDLERRWSDLVDDPNLPPRQPDPGSAAPSAPR